MKKLIYLFALAATLSMALTSCGGKDKDDDDADDMDDMTYVIQSSHLA
jgi:hypothetical protein